jgi:hypothetical protein
LLGPLTFTNFGPATARPLHHVDAAPKPTLIPLHLAGLRRGFAGHIVITSKVVQDYSFWSTGPEMLSRSTSADKVGQRLGNQGFGCPRISKSFIENNL